MWRREIVEFARLAAKTETAEQGAVPLHVCVGEVVEQPAPLADQLQQAATGRVIFRMIAQMLSQRCDALGEDCDLDLG
jgi:hypothetical protein